ncbi:hypothetical protein [Halomarina oriensis]|uniref:Uncharacterized protein n=1 Tax=Halomarina oriensis TaxID=671145 RepID=A0A6B0GS58_9EURY|nr:hypothetical protein [Halomarina oriensis]MWG36519.1 hypothetical protein [Halomarina oriensis]
MTDLSDFGGGRPVESHTTGSEETRTDRARGRRRTYRQGHGRCRAISKAKGCRCGGAIHEAGASLCHYHAESFQPVTLDDHPGLLARWCGLRATTWDELPAVVRAVLPEDGEVAP